MATGLLPLHADLSTGAQTTHILPNLGTSLISLGQLANDGCLILLDKAHICVLKNFKILLTGMQACGTSKMVYGIFLYYCTHQLDTKLLCRLDHP